MGIPSKLLSRLSNASEIIRRHDFFHIFSHYDADGISAAGIAARALLRENKDVCVTLFTTLNDANMDVLENCSAPCVIMTDMGASYLDRLDKVKKDVIVLDHHRTHRDSDKICYVNPHLFGADGMKECCGASLALLLAVEMDGRNWDLSQIALAGIAGDRQHTKGMTGMNQHILEGSVNKGHTKVIEGSVIPPGAIANELYLSTDPYISGVTGNADGVADILESAGLKKGTVSLELNENEERKLSSLIVLGLISKGVRTRSITESARSRYLLKDWNIDAETFADTLNACGRLGLGSVGVGMCLGDERSRIEAERLNSEYREKVATAAAELDRTGLEKMDHIQYFSSTTSGFTGILCGIAMQYLGDHDKPTIGLNSSEDPVKASARGTDDLLARGVDLSEAMSEASKKAGGEGGGHRIASGASFPRRNTELFLKTLDHIIKEQISAR